MRMMRHHNTQRFKRYYRNNRIIFQITVAAFVLLIGISVGLLRFNRADFGLNLFTEFLGMFVTVGIFDVLNRYRDGQQNKRQLQERLILDAGSVSNEVAIDAIRELGKRKWLDGVDGLLRARNLAGANLKQVELEQANLECTNFENADLSNARLAYANLTSSNLSKCLLIHAQLSGANLQEADLFAADLSNALLSFACLEQADLEDAVLCGADLRDANLRGANLRNANLYGANLLAADLHDANLENATLPDGRIWRPGIALENIQEEHS
ncbi:MAG: pentapeptide repeat-containing protein [Chloroflexi bacterium]|nr:MAG: hypothetical protein CUN54_05205 [Phototrophicales bacterium]RMF79755.1 MAG: pentapeptide repeat-containing protein [Chloroflexota bacterium]